MPDDLRECLPPDPNVPGRFVMLNADTSHRDMWTWMPEDRMWRGGHQPPFPAVSLVTPADAYAAGWRVHSPVVPPDHTS